MITGFNTDINYEGVTYHVQTEDKGVKTPLILSLVYRGGTILASKRSPYDDLLVEKFDEKVLEDRLNRQHKLICAAIRAGRVADLQKMTKKAAFDKQNALIENKERKVEVETMLPPKDGVEFVPPSKPTQEIVLEAKKEVSPPKPGDEQKKDIFVTPPTETEKKIQTSELKSETPVQKPFVEDKIEPTPPAFKDEFKLEVPKQIIEDKVETVPQAPIVKSELETKPTQSKVKDENETLTPPRPVVTEKIEAKVPPTPIVEEEPKTQAPIDTVNEEAETKIPKPIEQPVWDLPMIEGVTIIEDDVLVKEQEFEEEFILPPDAVEIIGDLEQFESLLEDELKVKILGENKFKSGDRKNINILVFRGEEESAVQTSSVMVKVIGSDFRPLIYHAKADSNGVATVFLKLPTFRSGRAALLIRAMVDGEETELRRAISPE